MGIDGTGPRANLSRDELDPSLTVHVETIGGDIDTGHAVIHDPDYLTPPGDYSEMTLAEALEKNADFCCDCFETAWVESCVDDDQY